MTPLAPIDRRLLEAAKAFLCWDTFGDLSIQLIPMTQAIGYFLPPTNGRRTIFLFYQPETSAYSEPLFLLFHEAGHGLQYELWGKAGRLSDFYRLLGDILLGG